MHGFDRVATLDRGEVVEDGAPLELLGQPTSRLASMCAKHGLDAAAIAAAAAARRDVAVARGKR